MKYTLKSGRSISIPDKEIDTYINKLGLSQQEAIDLYLEDHSFGVNEEQEELEAVASQIKIIHGASDGKKVKRKAGTPRVYINTDEKIVVYEAVKQALETIAKEYNASVEELKNQKLLKITFPDNDRPVKVDIIQKRPSK